MPLTFTDTPLYYKDSQGQYHRILSGADMTGYRTAAAQDEIDAGLVSAAAAQSLTAAQQAQARNNISAIDAGSIATIESSPATQAHAVGDYIIYNGQLYKVTAAIAQGESLAIGTNVEATNISNAVGAYESEVLATYAYGTVTIAYNSATKVCFLVLRGTTTASPANQAVILQLPNYIQPLCDCLAAGYGGCAYIGIELDGDVYMSFNGNPFANCIVAFPFK